MKINDWLFIEFHEAFGIDHLFHLGSTFHYLGWRIGLDLETCYVSRNKHDATLMTTTFFAIVLYVSKFD